MKGIVPILFFNHVFVEMLTFKQTMLIPELTEIFPSTGCYIKAYQIENNQLLSKLMKKFFVKSKSCSLEMNRTSASVAIQYGKLSKETHGRHLPTIRVIKFLHK